jgi:hypothetical protein
MEESTTGAVQESAGTQTSGQTQSTTQNTTPAASGSQNSGTQAGVQGMGDANTVAPAYVPNTKFKVLDQEKEFDEFIKPALSKDTEAKIRELYEKAHGLDVVKPKYQQTREQYKTLTDTHTKLVGNLNQLSQFVRDGDFDSYFQALRIPEQAVLQWVHNKLTQQQLPPEQQAVYKQTQDLRQQNYMLQQQLQHFQNGYETTQVQARNFELENVLSRPEVKTAISQYDSLIGQSGAFRNEVIQRASAIWHATQQDITAEEAVMKTIQALGLARQQANSTAMNPGQASLTTGGQAKPLPTIPNVAGRSESPTKKVSRSLDDLRKRARELDATA